MINLPNFRYRTDDEERRYRAALLRARIGGRLHRLSRRTLHGENCVYALLVLWILISFTDVAVRVLFALWGGGAR